MISRFEPRDPSYAERVQQSFARQGIMKTLDARLGLLAAGAVAAWISACRSCLHRIGLCLRVCSLYPDARRGRSPDH